MGAWEDGFAAGWRAALLRREDDPFDKAPMRSARETVKRPPSKKKRAATPAQKRYGKAFKKLAPKYKKKSGGWKKDGFKRCAAAARREAKR
jgi:hypothetical protein